VVVGDENLNPMMKIFLSRTRLRRVLEKHLNPRVEIYPSPTNTR